jgi:hypothetical protein
MNGCLRERTLFLLSEGEGSAAERAHLGACPRCAARYEDMTRASALAARVLEEGPLPARAAGREATLRPWSIAAALAVGLVLALVWRGVPGDPSRRPAALAEDTSDPQGLYLMSRVLFAPEAESAPAPDSDGVYLEAALSGESPCETERGGWDPRCQ